MIDKPNYYAVIPAEILFNKDISNNAKVLFGVISSLTNMNNKCFPSDNYFAEILNTSKPSIQRWLKELEINKIITRTLIYKKGTKSIEKRYIHIQIHLQSNTDNPLIKNDRDNINLTDNSINTTYSNKPKKKTNKRKTKFVPPSLEEVIEYATQEDRLDLAEKFYKFFNAGNWVDSKGNAVKSWKQKFQTWMSYNNKPNSNTSSGFF